MCMESGPVRLQRLAEVSQAGAGPTQDHPRMISSPIFYNLAYFLRKFTFNTLIDVNSSLDTRGQRQDSWR